MPINVELRDRSGAVIDVAEESWASIASMWPDVEPDAYPLLARIDRYGFTMFNVEQLSAVEAELERLHGDAASGLAGFVEKLMELCRRGQVVPDAELWFLGD